MLLGFKSFWMWSDCINSILFIHIPYIVLLCVEILAFAVTVPCSPRNLLKTLGKKLFSVVETEVGI